MSWPMMEGHPCCKAVIDNKAPSDGGCRMNVNPMALARTLRQEDREATHAPVPEPMLPPIGPDGVEARRKEYDVKRRAGTRVAPEYCLHILPHPYPQKGVPLRWRHYAHRRRHQAHLQPHREVALT